MSRHSEVVHFLRSDTAELLGALDELDRSGDGWVNIQALEPEKEELDASPVRAGLFSLVTARGPRIPVGTWVPGARGGRRPDPDSVGIQHAAGPKAHRQLLEAGVSPPEGSTLMSDHPRRGLVLNLAPGTAPAVVLDWLFAASDVLAAEPLPDTWVAVVDHR